MKLRTLKLFEPMGSTNLYQFFLTKLTDCEKFGSNLETLHLQHIDIIDGWLPKLQNLRQLIIDSPRILSCEDLSMCCRANPELKVFKYKGGYDLSEFYNSLPKLCPVLVEFSDSHERRSYICEASKRYDCLKEFKNLLRIQLTSYTVSGHDLAQHLRQLSSLADITKLGIFMCFDWPTTPIALSAYDKSHIVGLDTLPLNNLKAIEIEFEGVGEMNCDVRCEYMYHLISQYRNIDSVKISGRGLFNVGGALRLSTNIRRFCIAETEFRAMYIRSELESIMGSINRQSKAIYLNVSKQQRMEIAKILKYHKC